MSTKIAGIPYGPTPRAAAVASALAWPPRLIVIHDTGNTATAAAEAHFAATRTDPQANWTSCHAYVDAGGPLGSLGLDQQAWAAFSYANQHGIHLEMCGMNAGAPGAAPAVTISRTAALVAQLCDLTGIPKMHLTPAQVAAGGRGICGHYDITIGLGVGDHDDPGPSFNWPAFIGLVQAGGTVSNTYSADNASATGWALTQRLPTYKAHANDTDPALTTVGNPAAVWMDKVEHFVDHPPAATVTMTQQNIDAIVAGLAALVPTLQQIEDAAFRGAQRAEDS